MAHHNILWTPIAKHKMVPVRCDSIPTRLPAERRSHCHGIGVSISIAEDATVNDIDEALRHLSLVPENERGPAWHAYSDSLLEKRRQLETTHA